MQHNTQRSVHIKWNQHQSSLKEGLFLKIWKFLRRSSVVLLPHCWKGSRKSRYQRFVPTSWASRWTHCAQEAFLWTPRSKIHVGQSVLLVSERCGFFGVGAFRRVESSRKRIPFFHRGLQILQGFFLLRIGELLKYEYRFCSLLS